MSVLVDNDDDGDGIKDEDEDHDGDGLSNKSIYFVIKGDIYFNICPL